MPALPNSPLTIALTLLAAYLVGSIPFSLWIGRLAGGIDLRQHGSGNIGATNVARLLGWKWGVAALALDALKGLAPTGFLPRLFADSAVTHHLAVGCGLAAIIGHMFPIWLGFRGGKGVATSLGVVLMLAPWAGLSAAIAFAVCFAVWRYVSLSSIAAAIMFAVVQMVRLQPAPFSAETWSLAAFSIAVPLLVILRHRSNIGRLLRGEERAFTTNRGPAERPS